MMIFPHQLPYLAFLLLEVAFSLLIGTFLFLKSRDRLPAERLSLFLCPLAILVTLSLVANKIIQTPDNSWNGARLVPTYGLWYGAKMYVGPDGPGAIMNTIYPPISYLVYLPATLFTNPTYAVIAGSCLSALFFFAPPVLLSFSPGKDEKGGRFTLLGIVLAIGFFQLTVLSKPMQNAAFFVHSDAPMMGFLGLAGLTLYLRRGMPSRADLASAIFAALAVWSKQTSIAIVAALPLWIGLTDGLRASARYLAYLSAALVALGLMLWPFFDVETLVFNILRIPGKHPWFPQAPDLPRSFLVLSAEYFCVIAGLLASILLAWFARRQFTTEADPGTKPASRFVENRWLLFVLLGFAAIPTSMLSRIKMGGHWNNYAPTPYFLGMGLIALLMEWSATNRKRNLGPVNAGLTLIVLVLVLSPLSKGDESLSVINTLHAPSTNTHDFAYRYILKHPGEAYFPWNPLSHLLAEGKLYHFEFGMSDRELAGYAVSPDHFRQNIPENPRYVCFPAGLKIFGKRLEKTMRYLPEFTRRVEIEELPGWTCYER